MNRFILVDEGYSGVKILDQEHNTYFATLCETGFGLPRDSVKLAEKVIDFLNNLPPEETSFYPHNI